MIRLKDLDSALPDDNETEIFIFQESPSTMTNPLTDFLVFAQDAQSASQYAFKAKEYKLLNRTWVELAVRYLRHESCILMRLSRS